MKEFATAVVIAVSGIILLTVSSGDGLCFGQRPQLVAYNSTCSNRSDFATAICRLQCVFCHFGNVSEPYGCLTEGKNGTCICLRGESSGGNNGTSRYSAMRIPPPPEVPSPPDTPEQPSPPETPEQPSPPDTPEQPSPPDTPEQPSPPDTPEQPSPPDTPEQPSPPDTPEQPSPPEGPEDEEVPSPPEGDPQPVPGDNEINVG